MTCAKAYTGREKVVVVFDRYFEARGLDSASQYLKARMRATESSGLSVNDKSRLEAITGHALLANTITGLCCGQLTLETFEMCQSPAHFCRSLHDTMLQEPALES